eukprot:5439260-Pleurochrysis_carterae.AAC.1
MEGGFYAPWGAEDFNRYSHGPLLRRNGLGWTEFYHLVACRGCGVNDVHWSSCANWTEDNTTELKQQRVTAPPDPPSCQKGSAVVRVTHAARAHAGRTLVQHNVRNKVL